MDSHSKCLKLSLTQETHTWGQESVENAHPPLVKSGHKPGTTKENAWTQGQGDSW